MAADWNIHQYIIQQMWIWNHFCCSLFWLIVLIIMLDFVKQLQANTLQWPNGELHFEKQVIAVSAYVVFLCILRHGVQFKGQKKFKKGGGWVKSS